MNDAPRTIWVAPDAMAEARFYGLMWVDPKPGMDRYHHDAVVRELVDQIAEMARKLGGGCEANAGGDHTVITQGKYHFCAKCGEGLRGIRYCHLPRAALAKIAQEE